MALAFTLKWRGEEASCRDGRGWMHRGHCQHVMVGGIEKRRIADDGKTAKCLSSGSVSCRKALRRRGIHGPC